MTSVLRYLSHPQVKIDPDVPVPDWGLSEIGRNRTLAISDAPSLVNTSMIVSSAEQKATETAEIIGNKLGVSVVQNASTHENDRSATGFLPPDKFEKMADLFFTKPDQSVQGWERARDAQTRIVASITSIINAHDGGDVLAVGHGGVGTLLYCHFAGLSISREHDQPGGGGNFFAISLETRKPLHGWRPMEQI